ncbi:DUF6059 family protein [Kitasatospora sp. NPDC057015]|uniref:DUF6059 family protein n=1 Tax=Kitasatospora sp. NPDC057015 TaxID=3346001 RepID=UPI003641339B
MRRALRLCRRLLFAVLDGLAVLGAMSTLVPPGDWQGSFTAGLPAAPRRLRGPATGHPESVCADVPLSETESHLAAQLVELTALWPVLRRGPDGP